MFFDDWFGPLRVVVVGTLAYVGLVFLLRISEKRTLSKMNAFDFIVTVALGSTLATILLSEDVVLVEGMVALALLIFLQYIITWLSVRSDRFQHLIKSEPSLLVHRGRFLHGAMREQRVTEEEICAALRSQGLPAVEAVAAVVLESDGTISVVSETGEKGDSALANVSGRDEA